MTEEERNKIITDGKKVVNRLNKKQRHGYFVFVAPPHSEVEQCARCQRPHLIGRCREKIYGLIDPRDKQIRYVGRTVVNLNERFSSHYAEIGNNPHRAKNRWLIDLRAIGLRASIVLLDYVDFDRASGAENNWITKLIAQGNALTNENNRRTRSSVSL